MQNVYGRRFDPCLDGGEEIKVSLESGWHGCKRECLMFAFLCRAVQAVETSSLLQQNGKIQGNSQPGVHQGQQESPALPEEIGEKEIVP